MAQFRVETVHDAATSKIFAELYYPDTATTPIATTAPIYISHETAAAAVLEHFKKAFPNQPIKAKATL